MGTIRIDAGELHAHGRSPAGLALDRNEAAEAADPLPHALDAEVALGGAGGGRRLEATAVVTHHQRHASAHVVTRHRHPHGARLRVV